MYLGYIIAKHGNKYRVCLADPLARAPYKELYHETREAAALPRSKLLKTVAQT